MSETKIGPRIPKASGFVTTAYHIAEIERLSAENSHLKLLLKEVEPLVAARVFMLKVHGDPLEGEVKEQLERIRDALKTPPPSSCD